MQSDFCKLIHLNRIFLNYFIKSDLKLHLILLYCKKIKIYCKINIDAIGFLHILDISKDGAQKKQDKKNNKKKKNKKIKKKKKTDFCIHAYTFKSIFLNYFIKLWI